MLTISVKQAILGVWQSSECTTVICNSLFGKIEGVNNIDLVAM